MSERRRGKLTEADVSTGEFGDLTPDEIGFLLSQNYSTRSGHMEPGHRGNTRNVHKYSPHEAQWLFEKYRDRGFSW